MNGRPWTTREIDTLRECHSLHGISWDGWAEALPGRSLNAIKQRACKLGLRKHRPWTDRERAVVLRAILDASGEIGRTPVACASMALSLIRDERERRRRGERD